MLPVYYSFLLLSLFQAFVCYKDVNWWDSATIYNVYPKSFKDTDNDGVGDIRGIIEKLPYIKELGADVLYLNPIFKSPMLDTGYDISDFIDIDPLFGTMTDMEELIKRCKELGLRILIDFVPNHTSSEHEWFKKSVKKIDPYTDYYIWKNASGFAKDGTPIPPNNWVCVFGGSSWEWVKEREQFFYHAFYTHQPDLDYFNQDVVDEMKGVLKFWLDKNVDGIRVDALLFLAENFSCPDETLISPDAPQQEYDSYSHPCRRGILKTFETLKSWRDFFDEYSKAKDNQGRLIMIEYLRANKTFYSLDEQSMFIEYGADVVYNDLLGFNTTFRDPSFLTNDIMQYTKRWSQQNYTMNWLLGLHDTSRYASLMGEEMSDAYAMLMLLLPGNVFIYNGIELGMKDYPYLAPEVDFRLAFRTPFQWNESPQAGFSKRKATWAPVNPDYHKVNVEAEEKDPGSYLNFYKKLIRTRKLPIFKKGDLEIYPIAESLFAFSRSLTSAPDKKFVFLMNAREELECIDLMRYIPRVPEDMYVYVKTLNSEHKEGDKVKTTLCLPMRPKSAVLLATTETTTTSGTTSTTFTSLALTLGTIWVAVNIHQV